MAGTTILICPKCRGEMRTYERNGVVIDQCEECRGVFLDRGELEQLLDAECGPSDATSGTSGTSGTSTSMTTIIAATTMTTNTSEAVGAGAPAPPSSFLIFSAAANSAASMRTLPGRGYSDSLRGRNPPWLPRAPT